MPQNKIQFQPGMSISTFIELFGAEAQCEVALERARWPSGFVCQHCGDREHSTCSAGMGPIYLQTLLEHAGNLTKKRRTKRVTRSPKLTGSLASGSTKLNPVKNWGICWGITIPAIQ